METLTIALKAAPGAPYYPGVKTLESEDGAEQVMYGVASYKNEWQCTTPLLSTTDYNTFKAFWEARHETEAFLWTHPLEGVQHTVRFVPKSLRESSPDTIHWEVSFTLKKVLA